MVTDKNDRSKRLTVQAVGFRARAPVCILTTRKCEFVAPLIDVEA